MEEGGFGWPSSDLLVPGCRDCPEWPDPGSAFRGAQASEEEVQSGAQGQCHCAHLVSHEGYWARRSP